MSGLTLKLNTMIPTWPIEPAIRVYSCLLNQTGTNAPIPTILQNTLTGTPTWIRQFNGIYTCELSGQFPSGKTLILTGNLGPPTSYIYGSWVDNNSIQIETASDSTYTDGLLFKLPLLIYVYQ